MKVAIIGTAWPYRGGLAAYNERLAKEFQDQGHEVDVHTFKLQYPKILFPGKSQYSDEPAPNYLKISRTLNAVNPFNWISVGRRLRKQNYDLVVIKYWLPFMGPCFGTILRGIKKNKSTKVVCVVDNMIPHESRPGDKLFTTYFVKPVDAFVAMTQSVLDDIHLFDKQKPKLCSPHPVFDNFGEIRDREGALASLNLDANYRYVLFFGLIRKYKGLDLMLKAFGDDRFRERPLKLIVAGEYYADKQEYADIINELELKDSIIEVDKFIPDSEVADYFNACDLVVQPYKSATQSGVTQIAYHFNVPMIVTDVGGLKEMCPNEKVGFVVEPEPEEIAEAMIRFYDEDWSARMKEYIIEEKKKFSWKVLVDNIFVLLNQLPKGR